jgi:hypothetical protein
MDEKIRFAIGMMKLQMIGEDEYFVFLKDNYKARSRITYNFKTTI